MMVNFEGTSEATLRLLFTDRGWEGGWGGIYPYHKMTVTQWSYYISKGQKLVESNDMKRLIKTEGSTP